MSLDLPEISWRGVFLTAILTAILPFCTPIEESRLGEERVDQRVGFLSENAFQVTCSMSYLLPEDLLTTSFQEKFQEVCDTAVVKSLAVHKIKIMLNQRKEQEELLHKKLPLYQLKITWDDELVTMTRKTYEDLLPGRFVTQQRQKKEVHALYRIEKELLVVDIIARELPFDLEIIDPQNMD